MMATPSSTRAPPCGSPPKLEFINRWLEGCRASQATSPLGFGLGAILLLSFFIKHGGDIIWALVCAFAIIKGDRTERLGAGLLLVAWIASFTAQEGAGMVNTQYAVMAIDVITLVALSVLAWNSERSWPVWAAAFQAVETAVLAAPVAGLRIGGWSYIAASNLSSFGVMTALAVGTWIAWREREALSAKPG
jgi:hypothetical protein